MKNLKITIAAIGLIAMATACWQEKRHVIISEGHIFNNLKIEYSGRAVFNNEGTAIAYITPNGYVKYKRDGQKLVAKNDNNGAIIYQINDGDEQRILSGNDKIFLAQAVKDMIKHGHNNDRK